MEFDTFEWLVSQHPQKTLLPGLTEKLPCKKKNKGGRKNRYFLLLSPQPTQFDPSSQEAAGKESCLGAKRRAEAEIEAGGWAWAQLRFVMEKKIIWFFSLYLFHVRKSLATDLISQYF